MKKAFFPLMIGVALICGMLIGFFYTSYQSSQFFTDMTLLHEANRASETFSALRKLRAGDTTEGINLLESSLDINLISLSSLLKEGTKDDALKSYTNLLVRIGAYRAEYPHKSEVPGMDSAVSDAMQLYKIVK